MVRRSRSDDYIGPSTGLMKWINRFFRFILFPFIHPLIFVILLFVLGGGVVGIHHFAGVAYKDIPAWTFDQSVKMYKKLSNEYKVTSVLSNDKDETLKDDDNHKYIVRAVERKAFSRPQVMNEEKIEDRKEVKSTDNIVKKAAEVVNSGDLFEYYKSSDSGYIYSKDPRVIKGKISVVNANEIIINDEEVLLYGIYADPSSEDGVKGAEYLKNLVKDREAECRMVAFTQNADLTVICVVDGVNINRRMVDLRYSKNIALK